MEIKIKNISSYGLKKLIENGTVKKIFELPKNPLYIIGDVLWCGYWQDYYTVLDCNYKVYRDEKGIPFNRLVSVKIQWSNGKIGEHCTTLNNKDYRLILWKYKGN